MLHYGFQLQPWSNKCNLEIIKIAEHVYTGTCIMRNVHKGLTYMYRYQHNVHTALVWHYARMYVTTYTCEQRLKVVQGRLGWQPHMQSTMIGISTCNMWYGVHVTWCACDMVCMHIMYMVCANLYEPAAVITYTDLPKYYTYVCMYVCLHVCMWHTLLQPHCHLQDLSSQLQQQSQRNIKI